MTTQRRREPTRTAGIFKRRTRRGDVYDVRYRTKDRLQVAQTFPTLDEAEAFLIEQKHRVLRGTHIDRAKQQTTWDTVAKAWMRAKEMKGRKARTLKGYQHILDSWCAPWDDYAIGSISFGDVQALIESVTEKGRSPHTVRNVFNVVRGVLGYAVRAGYIHRNVALLVTEDLPALTHHEPHFLTAHEVELLARQFNDKGALIVRLAAWSGLRAGEIAGLRVKHVNQVRSKITVAETVIVLKNELPADTPKSTKSIALCQWGRTSRRCWPTGSRTTGSPIQRTTSSPARMTSSTTAGGTPSSSFLPLPPLALPHCGSTTSGIPTPASCTPRVGPCWKSHDGWGTAPIA